jgi:hypothetical protein
MFARTWAKRRLQERIGQPLSFDKNSNSDADAVDWTEGKTDGACDREPGGLKPRAQSAVHGR